MKFLVFIWLVVLSKEKQENQFCYKTKTDSGEIGHLYTPIEYNVGDTIKLK